MGVMSIITAARKSWQTQTGASANPEADIQQDADAELGHRFLSNVDATSSSRGSSLGRASSSRSYGATQNTGPWISEGQASGMRTSPERFRHDSLLNRVPEEGGGPDVQEEDRRDEDAAEEEEWELEERLGMYKGSYKRLITLYSLVPLSSVVVFVFLALLPTLAWPVNSPSPDTQPKYFPSPLPELLTSVSIWSLSHHIRVPLYSIVSFFVRASAPAIIISTVLHVIIHNLLRLSALPLLLVRHRMIYPLPVWHDPAYHRVWWLALGWSLADVIVGITQGYEQIALYRDVLVPEGRAQEFLRQWRDLGLDQERLGRTDSLEETGGLKTPRAVTTREGLPRSVYMDPHEIFPQSSDANIGNENRNSGGQQEFQLKDAAIRLEVDRDLDQLVAFRAREEIEEVYGVPVIKIPVFISCLQRLNSILLSLGLMLLLSASYLRSPISLSPSSPVSIPGNLPNQPLMTNRSFYITFPTIILLHLFLSFLHSPLVLPRIGLHVAAYVGVLVGLGTLFSGLAMWGALS